jgi:hypothetical protein
MQCNLEHQPRRASRREDHRNYWADMDSDTGTSAFAAILVPGRPTDLLPIVLPTPLMHAQAIAVPTPSVSGPKKIARRFTVCFAEMLQSFRAKCIDNNGGDTSATCNAGASSDIARTVAGHAKIDGAARNKNLPLTSCPKRSFWLLIQPGWS